MSTVKYLMIGFLFVGILLITLKSRFVKKENVKGVSFCDGGLITLVSSCPMLLLIVE